MALAKWFGAQPTAVNTSPAHPPEPIAVSSADTKQFGLENFGNTCYANSVLQALYFCAPFRELILQSTDHSSANEENVSQPVSPTASPIATPVAVPARPLKPQRKQSTTTAPISPEPTPLPPPPGLIPIPMAPPTLFSALRSLFLHISKNPVDKGVVAPKAFIDKLKEVNELFRSTMHQDAHEFLNYLLNKIVEEIEQEKRLRAEERVTLPVDDLSASVATIASKTPPTIITTATSSNSGASPEDATLVHRLFEGVLTSETRCLTCETVSSRDESFLDLSIDIEQNSSVTACLRAFSASEMLCQKNKFFCDSCCDLQEAEKRMKIKKLPNVLALHLKRFKIQEDSQRYIKLAYRVAFPFELRLFNTVDDTEDADRLYELFGVVVHIGQGPSHGHYISLIKTMGVWVVFDDGNVYPITENDIPKYFGESNAGSAYVLYYQAVDIDLVALGLRPRTPQPVPEPVRHPVVPDPSASSLDTAPALPPGLEDTDSSDLSEPSFPFTPLPSSPILSSTQPTRSTGAAIPLTANASTDSTTPLSVGPSVTNGKPHISSIFRRSPSYHASKAAAGPSSDRQPPIDKMPKPITTSSDEQIPSGSPKIPPSTPNGKERKEPERKPSTWFKRKSFRLGEKRTSIADDGRPSSPIEDSPGGSSWFKTGTQRPRDRKTRRPSESHVQGHPMPSFSVVRPSSAAGVSMSLRPDPPDHGYDSPSPGSATSSFGSTSAVLLPPPLPPPLDASSLSTSSVTVPHEPSPMSPLQPVRKTSLSSLVRREQETSHNVSPWRPATASPSLPTTLPTMRLLPPLPAPPSVPPPTPPHISPFASRSLPSPSHHFNTFQHASRNGQYQPNGFSTGAVEGVVPDVHEDLKGKSRSSHGDDFDEVTTPQARPAFSASPSSFGFSNGSYSATSSVASTSSNASMTFKRATRKLSLSGPLLGFGRHKHKEKERERERIPS